MNMKKESVNIHRLIIIRRILIIVLSAVLLALLINICLYYSGRKEYADIRQIAHGTEESLTKPADIQVKFPQNNKTENESKSYSRAEESINLEGLKSINSDVVGWIEGCEGKIDYPVVRGTDDVFYLRHDLNREWLISGCIFVQADNDNPFSRDVTVIYGHNMYDGSMFHELVEYTNSDYFKAHSSFVITTEDGQKEYGIFSVISGEYADIPLLSGNAPGIDGTDYIGIYKSMGMYETGVGTDPELPVVLLVTCESSGSDRRIVVCGQEMR